MENYTEMENSLNQEDEDTSLNEPQNEETDTPNKKTDSPEQYSEREKRYYARMKQAENIAKQAREELAKTKKSSAFSEVDAIIAVQEATRGLSEAEIAELKLRADARKISLVEARKDDNFALWQKAYREKVEKENIPLPSTTQEKSAGIKSLKEMTLEERTKLFQEMGLVSKKVNPRPPIV